MTAGMMSVARCALVGVCLWLPLTFTAWAQTPTEMTLEALSQAMADGNYAEVVRLAKQVEKQDPVRAAIWRGTALALQRNYKGALSDLYRACVELRPKPRYETPYEGLVVMRVACLALSGQREDALALARQFHRETAKLYAEVYPRPAILYGILLSLAMPQAAFTEVEVRGMLNYEDPSYEAAGYEIYEITYLQIRHKKYRDALKDIRRTYADPKINCGVATEPSSEALLLEAYLHRKLGETAAMRDRLRMAEQSLPRWMRGTQGEEYLLDNCVSVLLGRLLFPDEWRL